MATTPTNKPIPSEDPRDLKFNAGKIDEVVSGDNHYYTDRFGKRRFTIAGFQHTAEEAIRNYGYITMDSFEDGATLTLPNQVLRYEATGEYYRWDGEFPKIVSSGSTPETVGGVGLGAWVSVGDASLRSELADPGGPNLLGFDSSILYNPASVGYRLANSIDITDAPYNARPNQTDISAAFLAAASTGRPIYFPEPKNPANYYLITGEVAVSSNLTIHGPRSARIVFDGVTAGGNHIHATGRECSIFGLTLVSSVRGIICRSEPIDAQGVDLVQAIGTKFSGGFYSMRVGEGAATFKDWKTKVFKIIDCESVGETANNNGHFTGFNVDRVRYLNSSVKYGKNTAAFGIARCRDIVVSGCSEEGVVDSVANAEAACQIEDSVAASAKIFGNNFKHDIWIASSSNVSVSDNSCRRLRVSTGSAYNSDEMVDISFSNNRAAVVDIQKYGSVNNPNRCNVTLRDNRLDPAAATFLGSPFDYSYIIGDVCNLLVIDGNRNLSDAASNSMRLVRGPNLRMEIYSSTVFGSKPHLISGSGGRIISSGSLENSVPPQGVTPVADILLGMSSDMTPTSTTYTSIPWSSVAKNVNNEYALGVIAPIEDCVYDISGAISITSPSDGVYFGVEIYDVSGGTVTSQLIYTRLWGGRNTVPVAPVRIKLLAGKTYEVRYVTEATSCVILSGLQNTYLAVKAVI